MDWHARYLQQAGWTEQLRLYLFKKAKLQPGQRVLDLGCGTGALFSDFPVSTHVCGLDLSLSILSQAAVQSPMGRLICGDGARLPFADASFDLVFCHFVLLWVADPRQVVSEMQRVTRSGGSVLALAEPDYGGRIDYPIELAQLGLWQIESLRRQGADPKMGRQRSGIFCGSGLQHVESGVIGGEWQRSSNADSQDLEWQVLAEDLKDMVLPGEIQQMKLLDRAARLTGERVLFVPTFYALGVV